MKLPFIFQLSDLMAMEDKRHKANRLFEVQCRQDELDRFVDWLTLYGPDNYMDYYHEQSAELDSLRG